MSEKSDKNLADIEMLVLDVDGVLTDGTITINADGRESKCFNALDGHAIRMWRRAGLKVAFLSGRFSEPTRHRAKQLEVDHCLENCHDKVKAFEELLEKVSLPAEKVACIGDDLMDIAMIRRAGFGVAVANAVDEVKEYADFVTTRPGGSGAVREVVEYILKKNGKWQGVVERYFS